MSSTRSAHIARHWPLRKVLPADWAHAATRRRNLTMQRAIWNACRRDPKQARGVSRHLTAKQLPAGYPVDEHFNPPYDPWDQRLCLVPDGDLFKAIEDLDLHGLKYAILPVLRDVDTEDDVPPELLA